MIQQEVQSDRVSGGDVFVSGDPVYFNYRDERALAAFAANPDIRAFVLSALATPQLVVGVAPDGGLEFTTGPFTRACMPESWFTKLLPNVEDPALRTLADPFYGKCG